MESKVKLYLNVTAPPYEFFVDGKRELSLDSPGKTDNGKLYY